MMRIRLPLLIASLDEHEWAIAVEDRTMVVMMPLMTGLELAQTMRSDKDLAGIPIILVSGAQGSIGRAHPDVFDAVLDKPYNEKKLIETVSRLIQ